MSNESSDDKDNFVNRIAPGGANPSDTLLLTGYIGDSSEEGHTRLYFDPELLDYVDIPDAAKLHTATAPDQGPLRLTYVWIKRDAELVHSPVVTMAKRRATFLEGRMQKQYAAAQSAAAVSGAVPEPALPVTQPLVVCHPTLIQQACPSHIGILCMHTVVVQQCQTLAPALCITRVCTLHLPACGTTETPSCIPITCGGGGGIQSFAGCVSAACVPGGGGIQEQLAINPNYLPDTYRPDCAIPTRPNGGPCATSIPLYCPTAVQIRCRF